MKWLLFVAAVFAVALVANYCRWGYDDTDDKRPGRLFGTRSGLTLHTDHLTGVQYVKAGVFGAATPRIGKDGKPLLTK